MPQMLGKLEIYIDQNTDPVQHLIIIEENTSRMCIIVSIQLSL